MVADNWLNTPPPPRVRNADHGKNSARRSTMKIPNGCHLSMTSTDGVGTEAAIMTMTGDFKITTQADLDQMVGAMQAMGAVLASKKPRKRKAATPSRSAAARAA